jgi:hypothetical protein
VAVVLQSSSSSSRALMCPGSREITSGNTSVTLQHNTVIFALCM